MHMLSKKGSNSDEMETLWRSRNPTTVVAATGEGQTIAEAQVYVHDLDLFGLHFLSFGKLCEENGYTYEWSNGKQPRSTKQGKKN